MDDESKSETDDPMLTAEGLDELDCPDDESYAYPGVEPRSNPDEDMPEAAQPSASPLNPAVSMSPKDGITSEKVRQAQRANRRKELANEEVGTTAFVEVPATRDPRRSRVRHDAVVIMTLPSYVGSSIPLQSPSLALTPGSDIPDSLASLASDMRSKELAQCYSPSRIPGDLQSETSQDSDPGFVYKKR
ncbi:hypothetical protein PC121_g10122 [Phytophthora cactorum]|nr:hypothetical protein PC120_g11127 [Phytophthora cactorum]KAG3068697.1 hypothetical protein PC121_g10122 [Phytophthora cactorum]